MLQKQAIDISFAEGLDTKTDPKRVKMGKFERLVNRIFNKGGLLQKRNGYRELATLPAEFSYLTTFNENLTAVGDSITAYNSTASNWVSKGILQPLSVDTMPVIRNNFNQTAVDVVIASSGIACAVYLENNGSSTVNKYVVFDSVTGQNIVAPAVIPVASGTVSGGMRVFVLGNNFIIVFTNTITATAHLQYVAVNILSPTTVSANTDIANAYITATTLSWDGYVVNDNLYIAYNQTSGGQSIKVTYLSRSLVVATPATFAARIATMMSVTADITSPSNPAIYVSFYDSASSTGYTLAVDQNLNTLMAPQQIITTGVYLNLTSAAQSGTCKVFGEFSNAYSYDGAIPTNLINTVTVTLATSTVSAGTVSIRSVGLASKAFIIDGVIYYLGAYKSPYQPTYFLINGSQSTSASPVVSAKIAYGNGGGYLTTGLPSVTVNSNVAKVPYLFKDLIQAVNKNTNVSAGTQVNGIFSQTGINLGTFTIGTGKTYTSEIGNNLNISGGFLWMYDGYLPVEQNFFLYPDSVEVTTATGSGGLIAQTYFYAVTYEWTDNQGNAFRSAASIPVSQVTTTASSTNTIKVPTLRLTMKTANPVKIVLYRWSTGQPIYYQVTSITVPTQNSTTTDSVSITDVSSESTILGNNILYTNGGVVENIGPPACDLMTLFDSRFWLVDSEDRNLLWYSKQVIEATPVEMSDLFTIYVPPTTSTQGTTGPITSIAPMDDKLIIGKTNAFYYINGSGPDNTGANSGYSQAIFITATVGCNNQKSIILIPSGLVFQSDKGIWILDRGLNTSYIGSPVEDFTIGATVLSAVSVPGTNQIRFTLDTGITLMYDYFYDQWGVFEGIAGVSSCIYQGMHTFINEQGSAFKETENYYLDGSNPVLTSFKTGPLRLGDLQGYQRAYFFYLLGDYLSPHKMLVNTYINYANSPSQSVLITPTNFSPAYGDGESQSPYGQQAVYGGPKKLENSRVFLENERCMAFAIEVQEVFDPSFGTVAGAGFTMSGINVVMGFKKGYKPISSQHSTG